VIVICHNGVCADFNGENAGKPLQPIDYPGLAVRKIPARECVKSIQKCTPHAPAETVIYPFFSLVNIFAARQSHGPLCQYY
jgi:hypothetical protein